MSAMTEVCSFLQTFAPLALAEDWDNVGLLVGSEAASVTKIMTCLTVTPSTAQEAIDEGADLVVAHHPMPFRALKRLTDRDVTGRLLLKLIENRVAIYSPHTAFDSARLGINQQWAAGLGLSAVKPLRVHEHEDGQTEVAGPLGAGRYGEFTGGTLLDLAKRVKELVNVDTLRVVGEDDRPIKRVGIACGAAGEFLVAVRRAGCDAFVLGETNFHTCLEAEATDLALILPGHFASERFAVEKLADILQQEYASKTVWAARQERNPFRVL